jgi:hypothetical protein
MAGSRVLSVLITKKNGEHRVHLNGDDEYVKEVLAASKGLLEYFRLGVASGPEEHWRDLLVA